ncbi:MAG: hypothetical protein WBA46_04125 [Thermomicrobiales bacterium]
MSLDDLNNAIDSLDPDDVIGRDRLALAPAKDSLVAAGFYAYGMLDDENRWAIAVDDELGRVDVRVGHDGLLIILRASSPGRYAEEESPWRQRSRARLARMTLPRITRGFLQDHQEAIWDEDEEGIAVIERYELPFNRAPDVGAFVRAHLPGLEAILDVIERQLD